MDDVLNDGFYQDDFLSRTLNESICDKNALELSFADNNNYSHPPKNNTNGSSTLLPMQNDCESLNLDFLKLGSPDLEQMFMNIEDENEFSESLVTTASRSRTPTSTSTAAFTLEEDLLESNNCFTDTLQQLHDKQAQNSLDSLNLLDIPIKLEKEEAEYCRKQQTFDAQNCKLQQKNNQINSPRNRQRKQCAVKLNTQKTLSNNNKANWKYVGGYGKKGRENSPPLMHQSNIQNNHRQEQQGHQRLAQHHQSNCIPEQIVNVDGRLPVLNVQHLQSEQQSQQQSQQQQQQQHELEFLTQTLSNTYQRQSIQQDQNSINNSSITAQNINQIPQQMQQKILEQHLINQHGNLSNGNLNNVFGQNNTQLNNVQRLNEMNSAGIDEHTLKMFVENPHLAPINLEIQELIKRERKKLRNRIASSKCRKRKLEREGRLEDKVRNLKEKNIELNAVANALKQQICDLKQRVMDHVSEGCQIHMPSC